MTKAWNSEKMLRSVGLLVCSLLTALPGIAAGQSLQYALQYVMLDGIAFAADGRRGWAVGQDGMILATADGGEHWARQTSPTSEWLRDVAFAADGLHGWAVGGGGTILATADGGKHWTRQTSPTSSFLDAVAFADGLHGWAVGDHGTIVATADGGALWILQTNPYDDSLSDVAVAADGLHGWAVGQNGTILATADGGEHWTHESTPMFSEWLSAVAFAADGRHGWAVGDNGAILTMAPGRGGWVWQHGPPRRNDLGDVAFAADGRHGWAVGQNGTILATADGGEHWTRQTSPTSSFLNAVAFADGLHGWAVGDHGTIIATADGGAQWISQNPIADEGENVVMDAIAVPLAVQVLGALISAAVIAAVAFVLGQRTIERRYTTEYEAALTSFSLELEKAITNDANIEELVKATAIVSIRNSVRNELMNVNRILNSDIDTLSELLAKAEEFKNQGKNIPRPLARQIEERMDVLRLTWPSKKPQIDVALRKLLAEIGIERIRRRSSAFRSKTTVSAPSRTG